MGLQPAPPTLPASPRPQIRTRGLRGRAARRGCWRPGLGRKDALMQVSGLPSSSCPRTAPLCGSTPRADRRAGRGGDRGRTRPQPCRTRTRRYQAQRPRVRRSGMSFAFVPRACAQKAPQELGGRGAPVAPCASSDGQKRWLQVRCLRCGVREGDWAWGWQRWNRSRGARSRRLSSTARAGP